MTDRSAGQYPRQFPPWPNLAAMMFDRARSWGSLPMLRYWRDDAWQHLDWDGFARQAASAARALRAAGISAGDRVLLVSENRPEFPIAEVALMAIRAVPVPAYTTYTQADFAHLLADSGAQAAIVSTAALAGRVAQAGPLDLLRPLHMHREVYLSFLPLSHSFEHTAGQFFMLTVGVEVAYARGVETLPADMLAVRPTLMCVVPRLLEVIRGRILGQIAREPASRQALFARAIGLGRRRMEHERLSLRERLADAVLERLVRRRVRARFGGRLRTIVSGGARLDPEVGRFFLGLGIEILQGYGQTEAGPVISANGPGAARIESVGRALKGVDLRIAEDGEILVRGDLMMDGYWGRPQETEAVIRDGWLHTGDVGSLDDAGYLHITDRKRDLIVLSGGENVSPARIEGMLAAESAIAQAVVVGEGRPGLAALVVIADGCDEGAVARAIAKVNERLSVTERIRRHAVVGAFTIENGLLTATQKVRRQMVMEAHRGALEKLGA
jgi:long-chain acyl-CoA synthetase